MINKVILNSCFLARNAIVAGGRRNDKKEIRARVAQG